MAEWENEHEVWGGGTDFTPNMELVKRQYVEIFAEGNIDLVDEIFAEDFTNHDSWGMQADREGMKMIATMLSKGFKDMRIEAKYLETTDGKVVVFVENTKGVMVDDVFDATATNKESIMRSADMWAIRDGQITDRWSVMDMSKR